MLKKIKNKFFSKICKNDNKSFLEKLLGNLLQNNQKLSFIQIGGYDGISFDPIYKFITRNKNKVYGLILEPVRDSFEMLKYNYRNCPNITLLNLAVHNTKKEKTIYRVNPERLPRYPVWAKGVASFDLKHFELFNLSENDLLAERVGCISFVELINKYNIVNIDLLQVDTEGYDQEIILNMDFNRIKPEIIHFEHGIPNGIMSHKKFYELVDFFHSQGYEVFPEFFDAVAYRLDTQLKLLKP